MKTVKIVSTALFSALLAACGGGGGGGNAVRPDSPPSPPTPDSSLNEVPAQYRDIVNNAKTIPLSVLDDNRHQVTLGGKTGEYNFSDLPNGVTTLPISMSYQTERGDSSLASGTTVVYQQPYSVVTGTIWTQDSGDYVKDGYGLNVFHVGYIGGIVGFSTPYAALVAQNAIFDYKGRAFYGGEEATLNYTMDFGQREGHGSIAGFASTGLITLFPSTLLNDRSVRGEGKALIEKAPNTNERFVDYELSFYGPNAEELAGVVYDPSYDERDPDRDPEGKYFHLEGSEIIFAGKR